MSVQNVTDPMLLDSTGRLILTALQGIQNAVQPTNVYLDLAVSLPSSGWSNSSPYVYTWSSAYVTPECAVDVKFAQGSEDILIDYLEFEKVSGGVKFTAPVKPTVNIPVIVRILNADAESITSVSATMVSTSAVSGQSNVEQALSNVDSRTTTNSQAITSLNNKIETKQITSGYTLANAVNNQYSYISIIRKDDIVIVDFSIYSANGATIEQHESLITFDDIEAKYLAAGVIASSDEDNKCIPIRILADSKTVNIQRAYPGSKRYNGQLVFVCK